MKVIGAKMQKEEVKVFGAFALGQVNVKSIISEVNKYTTFSENTLEVYEAFKFDLGIGDEVSMNRAILFKDKNSESYISFLEKVGIEDDSHPQYITHGNITLTFDKTVEILHVKANSEGEITVKSDIHVFDSHVAALNKTKNEDFYDDFPFSEDYEPGQLKDLLTSQDALDGCLPDYVWCGQKCVGPNCKNANSFTKNKLDNCCREHDCCYTDYGVSRPHCYCDQKICDCAQSVFPAGAGWNPVVQAAFCFVC